MSSKLAEDIEDMFDERDKQEHPAENEEIIMKDYPIRAMWYQEVYTMDLGCSKKNISNWSNLKSNGVVFRRVVMCGRPFKKNKLIWDPEDVLA